jgi:inner membrane protein
MEPFTHFFTGACIGRAGLNRKTAYATLAATLAAEAADLDMFWGLRGPVEELKHHRGITHTLIGAPVVALATVGGVWLFHRWRMRRQRRKSASDSQPRMEVPVSQRRPPVRWVWLYLTNLIAAYSHILLDWTNNYGVRPFFPFNPQWYAGSFVFIADPILWALFLFAFVLPWLFGLADREIGARRPVFRGRGWAIFALAGMLILWGFRWTQHAHARALLENTQVTSAPIQRMALEPYPFDPFRWHAILETASFYQTAEVDTRTGSVDSDATTDVLYKPADTPAVEAAKHTFLGQVYLDWGRWAVVRDLGQQPIDGVDPPRLPPGRIWTTVEFSDLRFAYSFRNTGNAQPPASLRGSVYIIDNREDGGEGMGGRQQK